MGSNHNLASFVALCHVTNGDTSAFGDFVIDGVNLVTQLSGVRDHKNLNFGVFAINSQGRTDGEGTSLTCTIPSLSDKSVVGLLGNQRNTETLNDGGLDKTKFINNVVLNVFWDLPMLGVIPHFRLRNEWRSNVLGELVLDKLDLSSTILGTVFNQLLMLWCDINRHFFLFVSSLRP